MDSEFIRRLHELDTQGQAYDVKVFLASGYQVGPHPVLSVNQRSLVIGDASIELHIKLSQISAAAITINP